MDTLTHALSGALLARATAPQPADEKTLPLRRRLFIGFLAAAVPDLDFITPGRDTWPFRYGMCREDGGAWQLFQLDGGDARVPVR